MPVCQFQHVPGTAGTAAKLYRKVSGTLRYVGILVNQQVGEMDTYYAIVPAIIGISVAPHELRRTFAKLARKGSSSLEQIQLSLGQHASNKPTECCFYILVTNNTDFPNRICYNVLYEQELCYEQKGK